MDMTKSVFIKVSTYDIILNVMLIPDTTEDNQNGNKTFSYIPTFSINATKSLSEVETIIANPVIITATNAAPTVINIRLNSDMAFSDIEKCQLIKHRNVANSIEYLKSFPLTKRFTPPNLPNIGKKHVSL